jgi:hypothetical protein
MVTKTHILAEIRRVAQANAGAPPGKDRFFAETGIKENDWLGKYWARWSEAIKEAGFTPNTLQAAYSEDLLLEKLASLAKELGHVPGRTEIQLKARGDGGFPAPTTFQRLGRKHELVAKLKMYCEGRSGYEDVAESCAALTGKLQEPEAAPAHVEFGYVYLLRSGRFYKIGRSNAVGRRERELAIQLPEKAALVHSIKTDDPPGIEAYWHRRFQDRRKNGEWFELKPEDLAAFKRRRFM